MEALFRAKVVFLQRLIMEYQAFARVMVTHRLTDQKSFKTTGFAL